MDTPEIFISYTWQGESRRITETLDAFLQARDITIVRDNRDIGYKGLIKDYMQRLGQGKYVVVVLSDEYFKSKSCMFELLQLSRQEGFYDRIFPVSVAGLSIYEAEDLLKYTQYWDEKVAHLQQEIKNTGNIANLQGITDDLNLYVEIRQNIAKLINFLRNINTRPLKGADFDPLLKAIRVKIAQDQATAGVTVKHTASAEPKPPDQAKTVVVISGEGRRWAWLIGNNAYEQASLPALDFPEAQVDSLARVLQNKHQGDFDQVTILKGGSNTEAITKLKQIADQPKVNDVVLVYFAGYALLEEDPTGNMGIYLAMKNTNPDRDFLPSSAVPLTWIKNMLERCPAVQKIFILDCHYAGQCATSPDIFNAQLRFKAEGKYLITNAPVSGEVTEITTAPRITPYLVEGLATREADLNQSGHVTVEKWATYLQRQLHDHDLPASLILAEEISGDWILAKTVDSTQTAAKGTPASLQRNYKYIGEMLRDGMVIPFLGSGIVMESWPASLAKLPVVELSHDPPLEWSLAREIAKEAEFPDESRCATPLTVISQYYQTHVVGDRLIFYKRLKHLFPRGIKAGPIHRFLAQQPRPLVMVTTCYDTLLEGVLQEYGKPFAIVTHLAYTDVEEHLGKVVVQYSDRPGQAEIGLSDELRIDLEQWWVIYKIQGTFDLFAGKDELDSIVISEEDFVALLSRLGDQHRTIPALFNRLFQQKMFLFLGYRMTDWNFRMLVHILRAQERMRKVKGYAVRQGATEFERQYWESKNVQLINMTTAEFIQRLAAEMDVKI